MDGSEGLFQDVICTFLPVLTLALSFIFGKNVLEGYWKLSHMTLPVVFSFKTRFPESKSWALELGMEFVTFDYQITSFCPFSTTRTPSSDIVRTPLESPERLLSVSYPYNCEYRNVIIPYSNISIGRIFWAEESQVEKTPVGDYIVRSLMG